MNSESASTQDDHAAHPRASERRQFFLQTSISTSEHAHVTARVRNLSTGGMMVEFSAQADPELEERQRLTADLRNIGRVKGEVAWVAGRRYGIKFDRAIDPEAAIKSVVGGEGTPDYIKPVLLPERSLRYIEGLGRR